jgi:hypothetical protein
LVGEAAAVKMVAEDTAVCLGWQEEYEVMVETSPCCGGVADWAESVSAHVFIASQLTTKSSLW